jgi:hypothetical protein
MGPEMLIPLAGIGLPMVLVPTIIGMKHAARKREFEHQERMKALEMGRPFPGSDAWASAVAISIGAVVPLGALFVAWLTTVTTSSPHQEGPWEAAGITGALSVCCGSMLAWRMAGGRVRGQKAGADPNTNGKATYDPDAYDVVSRRG